MRASLIGMNPQELQQAVAACGGQPYAAKQLARWLYGRREGDLEAMTDLPQPLRRELAARYCTLTSRVVAARHSGEGTTKLAVRLHDGAVIECVLMREEARGKHRLTACISTQAGCAMGCRFCASGMLGLKRHLTSGEILEQFFHIARVLREEGPGEAWLTNVVVMGMGEPLHNFEGLMGAMEALNAPWGMGMGARRVTVSTVGLPERIRELAGRGFQFNLAVSLHAATDEQRTKLIPTNKATGLENIIAAAAYYFEKTGREVTFEYTLVGGQNDSAQDAHGLAELLRKFPRANVNLIPMNPVEGSGLKEPTGKSVESFTRVLRKAGVNVHVRRKRGRRVQAACGQLRLQLEASRAGQAA